MSSEKSYFVLMLETEEERFRSTWILATKQEIVKNILHRMARYFF